MEAADWLKQFPWQFHNLILQWISSSGRNILLTRIYIQTMKIKRKLFDTKYKMDFPVIFGDLNATNIPQYNTLTLHYRGLLITLEE